METYGIRREKRWQQQYDLGWPDTRIAAADNVDVSTIRAWRKASGLRSKWKAGGLPLSENSETERLRRYRLGQTDITIAKAEGVTKAAIWNWRRTRELSKDGPNPRRKLKRNVEAERQALYRRGLSDGQIAKRLGTTRNAVVWWRRARGLPINREDASVRAVQLPSEERRLMLYRRGLSDPAIAELEGVKAHSICAWRRRRGLYANPSKREPLNTSFVSLDADLGEGGFNLHGLIADDAAAEWLEDQGATVW